MHLIKLYIVNKLIQFLRNNVFLLTFSATNNYQFQNIISALSLLDGWQWQERHSARKKTCISTPKRFFVRPVG